MLAHTTHAHTHTHTLGLSACQSERNHIHSFNKYLSLQYGSGAGDKEMKGSVAYSHEIFAQRKSYAAILL